MCIFLLMSLCFVHEVRIVWKRKHSITLAVICAVLVVALPLMPTCAMGSIRTSSQQDTALYPPLQARHPYMEVKLLDICHLTCKMHPLISDGTIKRFIKCHCRMGTRERYINA